MPSRSVGKSGGSAISPSMPVTGRFSSVESTSASSESIAANASLLLGRNTTGSSPAAGAAAGDPALKLAMDSRSSSFSMFCVRSKSKDEAESGGRPANDFLDEFRCAFSNVSMSPVSSYWSKAWCSSESSEAMSRSFSESFCSLLQSKHERDQTSYHVHTLPSRVQTHLILPLAASLFTSQNLDERLRPRLALRNVPGVEAVL